MHIKADKGERIGSDAPAFSAFILAAWPAALQRLRDALLWMFPHGAGPTGPLDFTQIAEMNLGNFKVSLCETLVRRICGGELTCLQQPQASLDLLAVFHIQSGDPFAHRTGKQAKRRQWRMKRACFEEGSRFSGVLRPEND